MQDVVREPALITAAIIRQHIQRVSRLVLYLLEGWAMAGIIWAALKP